MATTTNYGWTTPDDTALVKDGAAAIRSLGSAIDTSLNTALGTKKAGMVLLNTTAFSGVTTQSINDVFSANYDNYKLILWFYGASASGALTFRYRVSGSDNSTANYARQYLVAGSTAISAARESGATSHSINNIQTNYHYTECDIINPFVTGYTTQLVREYYRADQNQSSEYWLKGNIFQATTSFTGFSLLSSGAAITGKLQVFGYNL